MTAMSSHEAFRWLVKRNGGVFSLAQLEEEWGQPQSTLRGWLAKWEKEAWIKRKSQNNAGTRIKVLDPEGPFSRLALAAPEKSTTQPDKGSSSRSIPLKNRTPAPVKRGADLSKRKAADTAPRQEQPVTSPGVAADVPAEQAEDIRGEGTEQDQPVETIPPHPEPRPLLREETEGPSNRTLPVPGIQGPVPTVPVDVPAARVEPRFVLRKEQQIPLPVFRASNALRVIALAAVVTSILIIAYHAAAAEAENTVKWSLMFTVAMIAATVKPVMGVLAEGSRADGDRGGARGFLAIGLLALMIDASILFAFRGEGLANRAATEAAAEAARKRSEERLELLQAEQKRLTGIEATAATATPSAAGADVIRLPGEIQPLIQALEEGSDPKGPCRWIQPRAERGKPVPEKRRANETNCNDELARLRSELARAEAVASASGRTLTEAEARRARLAELPGLIASAEADVAKRKVHGATDGGASIVARGVNWIPAGLSDAILGIELRPVEGRGVELFWIWGFVLVVEILALFGFASANRRDRARRQRLSLA